MKINEQQLKQIINEEIENMINEGQVDEASLLGLFGKKMLGSLKTAYNTVKKDAEQNWSDAQEEKAKEIVAAAREEAKNAIKKITNDFILKADQRGIDNPIATLELILTGILKDLTTNEIEPPLPSERPSSSMSGVRSGMAGIRSSRLSPRVSLEAKKSK